MAISTKKIIVQAFFDAAAQKPIDKVTVKDVVEACGITRQTFYYHFQDILGVIEWSMKQYLDALLARTMGAENMRDAVRILVSPVEEQRETVTCLMGSRTWAHMEELLLSAVRSYLETLLRSKSPHTTVSYSEMDTLLTAYSYAIIGVLVENCKRDHVDLDRLADQLYKLIRGQFLAGTEMQPAGPP